MVFTKIIHSFIHYQTNLRLAFKNETKRRNFSLSDMAHFGSEEFGPGLSFMMMNFHVGISMKSVAMTIKIIRKYTFYICAALHTCIITDHDHFDTSCRFARPILSHIIRYEPHPVRKPDFCLCENKGADQLRSNCEADQRLCFRCTDSTTPRNFKLLAIFYSCTAWFVSDLVGNPEDRFSHVAAHI